MTSVNFTVTLWTGLVSGGHSLVSGNHPLVSRGHSLVSGGQLLNKVDKNSADVHGSLSIKMMIIALFAIEVMFLKIGLT